MENDNAPNVGSIYGLVCSCAPEQIRYVGLTTKSIEERLWGHVYEAANRTERITPKLTWMRKHLLLDHTILIRPIDDSAVSRDELADLELFAMWACRSNGHRLTNSATNSWAIQPLSEITRQKLSQNARARWDNTTQVEREEWHDRMHSDDAKAKRKLSLTGKRASAESRAKQSLARTGTKRSLETRRRMSESALNPGAERRATSAAGAYLACHNRWHVKRGVVNPTCTLCSTVEGA